MPALFATAHKPHSRDIFMAQKKLPLDKLIKLQEGIIANKVNSGQYWLGNFTNFRLRLGNFTNYELIQT